MAWLGNLISRGLAGIQAAPDKVLDVKSDKYSNRPIIAREDCVVLYGGADNKYEIIMNRPCSESLYQAYSLYRTEDIVDAQERFITLKDKLPVLCNMSSTTVATIQKFCNVLQEYPSWNLCHLVVYFNLIDCVQNPQVVSFLNAYDPLTGVSPLQLAVQSANLPMITKLMTLDASVSHLDFEGNNVFHYAVNTNKDVIMALAGRKEKEARGLDTRCMSGYTPLHMACRADKTDCVKALLLCGADVNLSATQAPHSALPIPPGFVGDFMADNHYKLKSEEMKFGGTPLHWASSKEVIEALLDSNCYINALNFDSRTALHIMAMRGRLECVVALLSREADPDIVDIDGNTALHLAVKEKNIPIVQALIVFGVNLALVNNMGWSARHLAAQKDDEASERVLYTLHAVGAERCKLPQVTCTEGCRAGGVAHNGLPPVPAQGPPPRIIADLLEAGGAEGADTRGGRLLCLDGGGIRGLVLVTLLLHLEHAIGKPVVHCFDWLAATSTGAILALGLAAGKTLHECMCLYFRMKDTAFSGYRPYNSEPLEAILKETLGTDTTMADIKHPKVMIAGCLADRKPIQLHLFRNYESPSDMVAPLVGEHNTVECSTPYTQQLLWETARASGAAPSYFRAFGKYVDGGLIANNPTLDAITEIHEYNTALKYMGRGDQSVQPTVVVSIGTGSVPVTPVECMDIFRPSGIMETAKLMSGVWSIQAVLVDQATLADGRVVDRTRALCSMLGLPYFRFSPQLSEDIAMDETSDAKLVNMLWETKAYICDQPHVVNKLAVILNC